MTLIGLVQVSGVSLPLETLDGGQFKLFNLQAAYSEQIVREIISTWFCIVIEGKLQV